MDQFFRDRQGIDDDKKHTGGGIEPLCIPASSGFEVLTAHHEQLTDATTINKSNFYNDNLLIHWQGVISKKRDH